MVQLDAHCFNFNTQKSKFETTIKSVCKIKIYRFYENLFIID